MTNREQVHTLREALKAIRYEIGQALGSDRNPNKGDLHRVDRLAHEALERTK